MYHHSMPTNSAAEINFKLNSEIFTEIAWLQMSDTYSKIIDHPFLQELASGQLESEKFLFYIQQDFLYLTEFARALTMLAIRLPKRENFKKILTFSQSVLGDEQPLHEHYLKKYNLTQTNKQSPVCEAYTNYLKTMAATAHVEAAMAALLPCFWIYGEVGKLFKTSTNANQYHEWIALYGSEDFNTSVEQAIDFTNQLARGLSADQIQEMLDAFSQSFRYELMFWDSAYRLENAEDHLQSPIENVQQAETATYSNTEESRKFSLFHHGMNKSVAQNLEMSTASTAPEMLTLKIVWTIAGSDSGGGAGIQADLPTFQDFGLHGCSVITAITAQNSVEILSWEEVKTELIDHQLLALKKDFPPKAIKIGMLGSVNTMKAVKQFLLTLPKTNVILDPVMVATSGTSLISEEAKSYLIKEMLPLASVLTPNLKEVEAILGYFPSTENEIMQAANDLLNRGAKTVIIKGGHATGNLSQDYCTDGTNPFWLSTIRHQHNNTHGSGCTLSSAIAANLALGYSWENAIVLAKIYVSKGIRNTVQLGSGPGAVRHGLPDSCISHLDFPYLSKTSRVDTELLSDTISVDINGLFHYRGVSISINLSQSGKNILTTLMNKSIELPSEPIENSTTAPNMI